MSILIKDIKQVVTCENNSQNPKMGKNQSEIGLVENGNIFIEDDKIKFVGSKTELKKFLSQKNYNNYKIIDGSEKVVMPGFIDSHTHFVFSGSREDEYEMRLAGKTYQDIAKEGGGIISTVKSLRSTSKDKLKQISEKRLRKFLQYGTTTMEGKSGYGLDTGNEIKTLEIMNELNIKNDSQLEIVSTFLGAHGIPPESSKDDYINLICYNMIPLIAKRNLAKYIDIFVEENFFDVQDAEKIFSMGRKFNLIPKVHTEQFNSIGGIDVAIKFEANSVDHLEVLKSKDVIKLIDHNKNKERKITAVILPGVSYFLNIPYAPARELIDGGVPVVLATDFNPGSCMTENLQTIMSLASLKLKMSAEEILNAVTINAAFALGMQNSIGSIEKYKQADLLIFEMPSYKYLIYNFGVNNLETVIKKGKVIYNLNPEISN